MDPPPPPAQQHKRKRGRPIKKAPQPEPPVSAAVVAPAPSRAAPTAAEKREFQQREADRKAQLQALKNKKEMPATEKKTKMWETLTDCDSDRHDVFGTWKWQEQTKVS